MNHIVIAQIEIGLRRPRIKTLKMLARALRVRVATLVEAAEASR